MTKLDQLRTAARALIEKLDEIEADSSYRGMWAMAEVHGMKYAGPDYEKEKARLRDQLAAIDDVHDAEHKQAQNQFNRLEQSATERDDGIDLNCARKLREYVATLHAQLAEVHSKLEEADLDLHQLRFYGG